MQRRKLLTGGLTLPFLLSSQAILATGRLPQNIVAMSALELSAAIRHRQVSCVEVMRAYLAQIAKLNPTYNALVSLAQEQTLFDQAAQKDQDLGAGRYQGWMHGLPIAVKDLANAKGFVTSMGSPIFADSVANEDSVHVARMKQAGAIVIGKTNVPEFGLGSQSYNTVFGVTRNAYNPDLTAGGSSGGAAAGLALQMLPVADGSDFMGSLRNPAGFNNVIGFRPTPGVVPIGDSFVEALPCNGPMGRNVSDTAALLATIAGYHPGSPGSLPGDPQRFRQSLQPDLRGCKIGWLGNFDGYLPMQDGVLQLCEKALGSFAELGCEVASVQFEYPMEKLWQTWLTYRHWMSRGRGMALYANPDTKRLLKPEFIWEVEGGLGLTADDINRAGRARADFYRVILDLFDEYDFLLLPSAQVFPFAASTHWPKQIAGQSMDTYHRWMEVVIPGTLSGCPVINVPAGFSPVGLPMGLQLMGPRYQDFKTLQMAFAYEQASGWNLSHSPAALG